MLLAINERAQFINERLKRVSLRSIVRQLNHKVRTVTMWKLWHSCIEQYHLLYYCTVCTVSTVLCCVHCQYCTVLCVLLVLCCVYCQYCTACTVSIVLCVLFDSPSHFIHDNTSSRLAVGVVMVVSGLLPNNLFDFTLLLVMHIDS